MTVFLHMGQKLRVTVTLTARWQPESYSVSLGFIHEKNEMIAVITGYANMST